MSFIVRWLGLGGRKRRVGLRPHRDLELPLAYDQTYDAILDAIVRALGANVTAADRRDGTIEAAFGLVNNERVRCTVRRIDDAHTAVTIEALFPAGSDVPERSRAVDVLAGWLAEPR